MLGWIALAVVLCVIGTFAASMVMNWASNRAPLLSMLLGGVLVVVVIAAALLIAFMLASAR
jgi:hypothetical protein